jgi:enoyl-CoA hydratase
MSTALRTEQVGRITVFTLNRPQRRNALDDELLTALHDGLASFLASDESAVAIITGAGDSFCAGLDLRDRMDRGTLGFGAGLRSDIGAPADARFFPERAATFDKPVIAAVNGPAAGAGTVLALCADLCVLSRTAFFEITEVHRGTAFGWQIGHAERLPRPLATELALGLRVSAERAFAAGLATALTDQEGVLSEAMSLADRLLALPPLVLRANLELLRRLTPVIPADVADRADRLRQHISQSADAREAVMSFLDRRPPRYEGR